MINWIEMCLEITQPIGFAKIAIRQFFKPGCQMVSINLIK